MVAGNKMHPKGLCSAENGKISFPFLVKSIHMFRRRLVPICWMQTANAGVLLNATHVIW